MSLSSKNDGFERVPWLSFAEWHQVYKQIYSNDDAEQKKSHETLLIWKTRMPKLPVGVDCTLSLIQVCLRDREWSPKISTGQLPPSYEIDLRLLYSTTIMKLLNHLTNIDNTKQPSMFQVAKQLGIPDWIVSLRHDAAHGHDLPSIDLFRVAANILLTWLHDEYWAVKAAASQTEFSNNETQTFENDKACPETLNNLISLWITVNLYITADYVSVSNLTDENLQETLNDLRSLAKKPKRNSSLEKNGDINDYSLKTAKFYLLGEIYSILKNKKILFDTTESVLTAIFSNDTFLPNKQISQLFFTKSNMKLSGDITHLPKALVKFWQPFIAMLHEREMLDSLVLKLIDSINSSDVKEKEKKFFAALWVKSIAQGLLKLKIAHKEMQTFETSNKRITPKKLEAILKERVKTINPKLQHGVWLNLTSDVPEMFTDIEFIKSIIMNPNELTVIFIKPIFELVKPKIKIETINKLLDLINIYTGKKSFFTSTNLYNSEDVIYTKEDVIKITGRKFDNGNGENDDENNDDDGEVMEVSNLADTAVRNNTWELATEEPDNAKWSECEFGVLPWQIDTLQVLDDHKSSPQIVYSETHTAFNIIPGFVDRKNIVSRSQVQWDKVLRKKQRRKRKKLDIDASVVMSNAMEIVKKDSKK